MTDPKGKSLLEKIRARMPRQEEASVPTQDRHHAKFWEIFFKDSQAACMPVEWQHELANYLLHGFTPGSFHRAVVENNLAAATRTTHQSNEWIWLCGFMWFLQRYAPAESGRLEPSSSGSSVGDAPGPSNRGCFGVKEAGCAVFLRVVGPRNPNFRPRWSRLPQQPSERQLKPTQTANFCRRCLVIQYDCRTILLGETCFLGRFRLSL